MVHQILTYHLPAAVVEEEVHHLAHTVLHRLVEVEVAILEVVDLAVVVLEEVHHHKRTLPHLKATVHRQALTVHHHKAIARHQVLMVLHQEVSEDRVVSGDLVVLENLASEVVEVVSEVPVHLVATYRLQPVMVHQQVHRQVGLDHLDSENRHRQLMEHHQ